MKPEKIILFPIEVKSRELNSKLFFASRAIRRGYEVWIGFAKYFHENMPAFPRGILIENDVGKGMGSILPVARRLGFAVSAWDEEALVVKNDDFYVDERVPRDHIRECYRFFTRGLGDCDAIAARYPEVADRLVPAGNPRIDILAPAYQALHHIDAIEVDRPVLLVNSRFSHSNPFHMERAAFREGLLARSRLSGAALDFKIGYMDHTDALYEAFHAMVSRLPEAFPQHLIVIRPHPSENPAPWQVLAERFEHVIVSKAHTATAWSMIADATIHNGCTTAVEAAMLGCNVVAHCPLHSDLYDVRLPNRVSIEVETTEQLIDTVRGMSKPSASEREVNAAAARHRLDGIIGDRDGRDATDIVLDTLDGIGHWPDCSLKDRLFGLKYRYDYRRRCRDARAGRMRNFLDAEALLGDYAREKFAGLMAADTRRPLEIFGAADAVVTELGDHWLRITAP